MKPLSMILALSKNDVLGKDNALAWHVPEDLKHFKAITKGHPVIQGRKTYESVGKPLPNRLNIVVSRTPNLHIEGCEVAPSVEVAIELARKLSTEIPFIIGGKALYQAALPYADRIFLTRIDRDVEGDVTYTPDLSEFEVSESWLGETPGVTFYVYRRRPTIGVA
jgi:dihydrofolate reductase